ncbi:VOC family protein [Streptomyces sp. NBC_01724]|uniref:VOC family protein n=1 Tax=unclassified Streptomyces TaxID=2593676 RepID=UPI002DDA3076|nr:MULTISPECIES: VOC family protein [unclassified Streptomyces]WSC67425.1 VOC family protein [Streptomyces sp. NBC_01760]WTE49709.1 VOC family protein [Streptomyces sp. NBC_01620]WTE57795.1 VOC family protein [Streptomyces sp. NBC_01617]WTI85310.1 VOC family protein [Streptomyces sp. NBC_00724]
MTGSRPRTAPPSAPLTGPSAPCWVNLMTRDLKSAQEFYTATLGWTFRPGKLGQEFSVARRDDVPVAGIAAVAPAFRVAVAWTPYFAVQNADVAASRIRERSGTVAVGPLALGKGRGALAADRDGAVFGIWERTEAATSPPAPDDHSNAWLELRTRDAFDAAIFYGQVLDWATGRPGDCEVSYEKDQVVVDCGGKRLARISSGAVEAAPDPLVRPHWQVHFPVADVAATVSAARQHGGSVVEQRTQGHGAEATLLDPDGGLFTVTDIRSPVAEGT